MIIMVHSQLGDLRELIKQMLRLPPRFNADTFNKCMDMCVKLRIIHIDDRFKQTLSGRKCRFVGI